MYIYLLNRDTYIHMYIFIHNAAHFLSGLSVIDYIKYTRKNVHICYRSANKLQQDCCHADIRMCSHCLFPVIARLMAVTDLLLVVPTRLIQAVRNKLLPC
jgi:hypothetical protein